MAKSKDKPEAAPSRPSETWEEYVLKKCAMAMGNWLQQNGTNFTKPINKISLPEMMGMAWACCAEYTDLREIERKKMRISVFDDEAIDDLGAVIRRASKPAIE